jgi:hypothetical protein
VTRAGIAVAVDGAAVELNVSTTAAAQDVADHYGRRVRLFCRWTRRYIGDLAPRAREEEAKC